MPRLACGSSVPHIYASSASRDKAVPSRRTYCAQARILRRVEVSVLSGNARHPLHSERLCGFAGTEFARTVPALDHAAREVRKRLDPEHDEGGIADAARSTALWHPTRSTRSAVTDHPALRFVAGCEHVLEGAGGHHHLDGLGRCLLEYLGDELLEVGSSGHAIPVYGRQQVRRYGSWSGPSLGPSSRGPLGANERQLDDAVVLGGRLVFRHRHHGHRPDGLGRPAECPCRRREASR